MSRKQNLKAAIFLLTPSLGAILLLWIFPAQSHQALDLIGEFLTNLLRWILT